MELYNREALRRVIRAACLRVQCPACNLDARLLIGVLVDNEGSTTCQECGWVFAIPEKMVDAGIEVIVAKYLTAAMQSEPDASLGEYRACCCKQSGDNGIADFFGVI